MQPYLTGPATSSEGESSEFDVGEGTQTTPLVDKVRLLVDPARKQCLLDV